MACLSVRLVKAKLLPLHVQTTPLPPLALLAKRGHAGKVYELAGDTAWTLGELSAELSKQSGKTCQLPQPRAKRISPPR